jgi:ribosomal-protein-alanine N-acetyltransferase
MVPLSHADLDEILAIENGVYPFPWTRGNFVDSLASGYSLWGCRVADELVGYFVLMMAVDEAHLLNISIAEKRQGAGFGARLLDHAMRAAHQAGATSLLLEVRPSNPSALATLSALRLSADRRAARLLPGEEGTEDALVMRHVLGKVSA